MVILGSLTIGIRILLMTPQVQLQEDLLHGTARTKHTAWMAAIPLNLSNHPTHVVPDIGCTRSIGSRAAIRRSQKHVWCCGIATEFCVAISPLCLPTLRWRLAENLVFFIFQRNLHVRPELMCSQQVYAYLILTSANEKFGNDY